MIIFGPKETEYRRKANEFNEKISKIKEDIEEARPFVFMGNAEKYKDKLDDVSKKLNEYKNFIQSLEKQYPIEEQQLFLNCTGFSLMREEVRIELIEKAIQELKDRLLAEPIIRNSKVEISYHRDKLNKIMPYVTMLNARMYDKALEQRLKDLETVYRATPEKSKLYEEFYNTTFSEFPTKKPASKEILYNTSHQSGFSTSAEKSEKH